MNSTTGLHVPCQAATAKVLDGTTFSVARAAGVIHIKMRKIIVSSPG
jgi:hypothetical protein